MSGQDWGLVKEWWANVYPHVADHVRFGGKFSRRDECERFTGEHAAFRIHVRLKPEGAPRRYATITEQDAWEIDPVGARIVAQQGNSLRYSAGSGFYVADYNSLKTEESAS